MKISDRIDTSRSSRFFTFEKGAFLSSLLLLGLISCGETKPAAMDTSSNAAVTSTDENMGQIPNGNIPGSEIQASANEDLMYQIPTSLSPDASTLSLFGDEGFGLNGNTGLGLTAAAATYKISITGCASGLTGTATEADVNLKVYKQDRGCLGQLTEFTYLTKTYKPKTGFTFTTWLAGNTATFENTSDPNPNDRFSVTVISQLSSPTAVADTIQYRFSYITVGTTDAAPNVLSKTTVGESHAVSIPGQNPPNFNISLVTFPGISATGGTGQFIFKMTCNIAMVGDVCDGVNLTEISYKLIKDTYTGVMFVQDAQAIFPTGQSTVTVATDKHLTGNSGFNTVTLTGPGPIHQNPNMILVLGANNLSFQYFNVDVQTVTNP
ncbi:MAG: hypothetical protein KA436_00775 [Oligoflexales bacterium]|nr:hypothetical protein [Oligoflexales bacterium]